MSEVVLETNNAQADVIILLIKYPTNLSVLYVVLIPHHVTLPVEEVALRIHIKIQGRSNHGVVHIQDTEHARCPISPRRSCCSIQWPRRFRRSRITDRVRVQVRCKADKIIP